MSYQRAMILVTASSLLVPVFGLATAPILTHSLGVVGRGEAAAALAPNLLIVGGVTLGLPQALTFHLAKHPHLTRVALAWSSLLTLVVGGLALWATVAGGSYLAGDNPSLSRLIAIGTWWALPALLVGLLRGAASGRQMWTAIALERVLNSVLRVVLFGFLAFAGRLDVFSAVLVMCVSPVVAGVVYLKLAVRPEGDVASAGPRLVPDLTMFGSRVWLGSVAVILTARMSQLLITPLSDVGQLGLLIVAVTVSDIPYIVTQTVRDVAFGVSSAEADSARLLATSRIATLVAFSGSLVLGVSLPFWVGLVFGDGFSAAVLPTWLLLAASCLAVPGLIAGAGLDAAGRPGLRSLSLVAGLALNLLLTFILVPRLGATGAAVATLLGTALTTGYAMVSASPILRTRSYLFVVPQASDVDVLRAVFVSLRSRVRVHGQGAT